MNMKLCVSCRQYVPRANFNQAHHDFPTRDGLNHCCRHHDKPRFAKDERGVLYEIKKELQSAK